MSDAEVAEIGYTARLVGHRVKDARYRDALFAVWRYQPSVTNTGLLTAKAVRRPKSLGRQTLPPT